MLTNTRLLIIVLLLFTVVAITACISQTPPSFAVPPTPALTTVRVAYVPLVSNGPIYMAMEEGYFARQGIDVKLEKFQSGAATIPALVNGDIDVAGGAVSASLINVISKGAHVRIVADKGRNSPSYSCNASGLMVRRDLYENGIVTKVSDLKGRRITSPAGADYKIYRVLKMGNLTADDVEVVTMDMAAGIVALKNGAVDACDTTEPYVTQLLDDKVAVMLVPMEVSSPDFPTPLYYGPNFLDKDPDVGRRFMVAYLEGVRQYNLGKTERNIEILSNYTNLDRDMLQKSCWVPIAQDGDLPRQPVRDYMDWMYANKQISQNPDNDQVFDMSFITYANGIILNTTSSK
jgi:ABC-type nitrate/sulfonate/bicarbonate transport system substrate-binding protein